MKTITLNIEKNSDYKLLLALARRLGINISIDINSSKKDAKMSKYRGIISSKKADALQKQLSKSRDEWEEILN
ncbi:MAG: hypothetical protein WD048_13370 [Chitinophagales bacterium]